MEVNQVLDSVSGAKLDGTEYVDDACGKNRTVLGNWFSSHGGMDLLLDPRPPLMAPVIEDPYLDPSNPPVDPNTEGVCGMMWSDIATDPVTGHSKYWLRDFTSLEECEEEGFTVTHGGHCGACSSLQDLGVYIRQNLLTDSLMCWTRNTTSFMADCLMTLGISQPCATIWTFNIINTVQNCLEVCQDYDTEPNKPDGSLNDCLQCYQDRSVPIFKYFSGRLRRNSGITSTIHWPEDQIYSMEHCYWYGDF